MNNKTCNKCGDNIPEGRLKILPNTKTCVKCSEIGRKGAITVQLGEGDHIYNEIIILEPEELNQIEQNTESSEEINLDNFFGGVSFDEEPMEYTEETSFNPKLPETEESNLYDRDETLDDEENEEDWELSE